MKEQTKFRIFAIVILTAIFISIILMGLSLCGCIRPVYMDREHSTEFTQLTAAVVDWDRRCVADPNTCAESLHSMAQEFIVWYAIFNGFEPNEVKANIYKIDPNEVMP